MLSYNCYWVLDIWDIYYYLNKIYDMHELDKPNTGSWLDVRFIVWNTLYSISLKNKQKSLQ